MKTCLFFLLCIAAGARASSIESRRTSMQNPPFWMPSFDEFHDLQANQKDYYSQSFLKLIKTVTPLSNVKGPALLEAQQLYTEWDNLRAKVYDLCDGPAPAPVCAKLAEARVRTLMMNSTRP